MNDKLEKALDGVVQNTTSENLDKLMKALDEIKPGDELGRGGVLQTTDMMEAAAEYLSAKTVEAMKVKAMNLTSETTTCLFLGATVAEKNLDLALQKVSRDLNKLANADLLSSCLAPLTSVKLAKMPGKQFTVAVVSYVHVPTERVNEAKNMVETEFDVGGVGATIGSLDIELGHGEFFAFVRTSVAAGLLNGGDPVQEEIDRYLSILPKGTELVSRSQCAITDLSVTTEVIFKNPLLGNVKEVQLDYTRICCPTEDNQGLLQGVVVTGVRYLDKVHREMFK